MRHPVILSRRRRWSAKRGTPQDGRRTPFLITRKGGGVSRGEHVGGPSTVLRCFGFAYAAPAAQDDKPRRLALTTLLLLLILSCHRTNIDRAQWQSMSANEKTLYVRTLLGHEKTKDAKGGNDRVFTRSINSYVMSIDDAYARGDARSVDAIFESMGSPR